MIKFRAGFVYSMKTGNLTVRRGTISENAEFGDRAYMKIGAHEQLVVSNEPGVLYNGMIWLKERDDDAALSIYLEAELSKIQHLNQQIEAHLLRIRALDGIRRAQKVQIEAKKAEKQRKFGKQEV